MNMDQVLLVSVNKESKICKWDGFMEEMKKMSCIAIPMVLVTVSQNLLRVISMMMVGHLGELSLSGAAVATSLTNVTGFSLMVLYFSVAYSLTAQDLLNYFFWAKNYQLCTLNCIEI